MDFCALLGRPVISGNGRAGDFFPCCIMANTESIFGHAPHVIYLVGRIVTRAARMNTLEVVPCVGSFDTPRLAAQ